MQTDDSYDTISESKIKNGIWGGGSVSISYDHLRWLENYESGDLRAVFRKNILSEAQLKEAARLVSERLGGHSSHLVYQSRSGPPHQPWLEPDICDFIKELGVQGGIEDVVIVPIGFVSDHMEVLFDLDTEAKDVGNELGINVLRAKTVGVHPRFITMIRELIEERISGTDERPALGEMGASHDVCPVDCCLRVTEVKR